MFPFSKKVSFDSFFFFAAAQMRAHGHIVTDRIIPNQQYICWFVIIFVYSWMKMARFEFDATRVCVVQYNGGNNISETSMNGEFSAIWFLLVMVPKMNATNGGVLDRQQFR